MPFHTVDRLARQVGFINDIPEPLRSVVRDRILSTQQLRRSMGVTSLQQFSSPYKKICSDLDEKGVRQAIYLVSSAQQSGTPEENSTSEDAKPGYSKEVIKRRYKKPLLSKLWKNVLLIEGEPQSNVKVTELGMKHETFMFNLQQNGYEYLFKVQLHVIPWLLESLFKDKNVRQDLCVQAPPGSGKTICYLAPILHSLLGRFSPRIRLLIVVPLYDLGLQIAKVTKRLLKRTNLRYALGKDSSYDRSTLVKRLPNGSYESTIDVFITTPGYLFDHLNTVPGFSIAALDYLVIDEADRVLTEDRFLLNNIMKYVPQADSSLQKPVSLFQQDKIHKRPQILLFSATLFENDAFLRQLDVLHYPKIYGFSPSNVLPEKSLFLQKELTSKITVCDKTNKPAIVSEYLSKGWRHMICFMKTNYEVHRLASLLTYMHPNITFKKMTGDIPVAEREKNLRDFNRGNIQMIITTDRMARGIDIPNIDYIILYAMSLNCEDYIHRAGRTGRAGRLGTAISLLSSPQVQGFKKMLGSIGHEAVDFPIVVSQDKMLAYKRALCKLNKEYRMKKMKQLEALKRSRKTKTSRLPFRRVQRKQRLHATARKGRR